ncbi:hypothetical protein OV924_25910, partial [Salmonella enterica subsp. enterica serovar 1,4,[5],12:i:-]|uniref:hypothetical protein n=1 Tax=Enterobacteriaceae TaxID=543 RepID=UPI001BE40AFB
RQFPQDQFPSAYRNAAMHNLCSMFSIFGEIVCNLYFHSVQSWMLVLAGNRAKRDLEGRNR